ncbi:NADH-ubiquinone oxidoreductase ASHI subunit [Dictyocaulus viviparus]|uniref:NADH-ubiquinone oxidoreductase ASHI subunit n=1 Tax=Dictyocaulus viviparus TaxID=29172 RepID=A0A0D8XRP0_DICVI|nr:NADH-ubiquinone oxidoreductase ASHI subunit [Dictyocaulus viviparus]
MLRKLSQRSFHTSRILSMRGPLTFPGWYPRDHKPGPYPVTDEERRAAAMKYGLRPEDYKPIDQDDVVRYAGDYPDFGIVTYLHKDPYESWTDRLNRRNWGEMVSMDMMRHRGDRMSFTGLDEDDFTLVRTIIIFMKVLVPMGLIMWYCSDADPSALHWKNPSVGYTPFAVQY